MLHDIRLALRALVEQKAFTSAALVTLALGIGANTAIFSIVYGVLVRPLPFVDPDRIVQISEIVPGGTPALPGATWVSNLSLHTWEPHRTTVGPFANFGGGTWTVGLDTPRRVRGGTAGPAFFDVLGVIPVRGRFFRVEDVAAGAPPVVVLSSEMWRDEFGRDENVIGRTIEIDQQTHQIIGVAPPNMTLPTVDTRFWIPVQMAPLAGPNSKGVRVEGTRAIARLAAGVTPQQAAAEGTMLARGVARPLAADMLFGKGGPVEIHVRTLRDQLTSGVRPALIVLLVAVGLLLLVACANVANLLLSRGVSRERELAVRVALGASRQRLIREVLTESVVVSCAGGMLGVLIAWVLVRALPSAAPQNFPRLDAVQLDWRALAFACAVSIGSGLIAGLVPALRGARPDLLPALREGAGASSSRRTTFARRTLLIAESAMAVMLLIGATLLGRSFMRLMATDAGYDPSHVLTARVYLPGSSQSPSQSNAVVRELLARLRALPGVEAAGASNMAPFGQSTAIAAFTLPVPGRAPVTARTLMYVATPGYAEALRLRLVKGRLLEDRDLASGTQAVVVNEQFVRAFLEGADPIGLRFDARAVEDKVEYAEIVGVVGNVLKERLDQEPQPEMYIPPAHGSGIRREVNIVLRTAGDPAGYADDLRRIVKDVRADAAVDGLAPLTAKVADSVAQPRFAATVMLSFATLALVLAAVGLYGVLSYTVARRRREIGVRSALGATRGSIVSLIVREGMTVAVFGLLAGLGMAAALTQLMRALLIGIEPLDPLSFGLSAAAMLAVALIACAIPARSAAATDPAIALRME